MTSSKPGKIAPYQLFFFIFVSRVVVSLTYVQSVSVGKISSDLLISVFASWCLTMLVSIPVYLCVSKGKNPFKIKWIAVLYSIYFIYFSAVNVSRFSYFATTRLTPESSMLFFIIAILLCACYGAVMGIEGLGRFGAFCGIILLLTVAMVVVFNTKNADFINLFPIVKNTRTDIIKNIILLSANSIEPAVFLSLEDKVNGDRKKPLFLGITASYAVIFLLILMCQLVMGFASQLQAYPIFALFQLASMGSMSRLDIFHIAFWVPAIFLKVSGLVYCSTLCVKKYKHSVKCVIASLLSVAVAVFITMVVGMDMINLTKVISTVMFVVYSVIIPLISILFIKKSRVDNVVEKMQDY